MPFAAATSEHPITAHAMGEVVGHVLEVLGPEPDLVLLFVTPHHGGALEDAAGVVRAVLHPTTLVAAAAAGVVGTGREVEGGPGVSLLAARLGAVLPLRVEAGADAHRVAWGWPESLPFRPSAVVLLADPFSFRPGPFFTELDRRFPGVPVIGGMASSGRGPGGNRLGLDDVVVTGGAVAAILGPEVQVETIISQGCRPAGPTMVVTQSSGDVILELAGRSPRACLEEVVRTALLDDDLGSVDLGRVQIGRVLAEARGDHEPEHVLVRPLLGLAADTGGVIVEGGAEVGTTVQFQLHDAARAAEDLRRRLAGSTTSPDAALLFTGVDRGRRLFGMRNHDAGLLAERTLGGGPVAGMSSAGTFGPVGAANFVHTRTAAVALLRDRRR